MSPVEDVHRIMNQLDVIGKLPNAVLLLAPAVSVTANQRNPLEWPSGLTSCMTFLKAGLS